MKNGHMKNADLFRLQAGLNSVGELKGAKFCYAIAKNKRIVGAVCDDLRAAVKPGDAYTAYDRARIALLREHAEKDERNRPKQEGNTIIVADQDAYETALKPLQDEYAEAIAEQEEKQKDFEALLEEPADVALYKIPFDLVPDDINEAQFDGIFEIVDGEPTLEPEKAA